MNKKYGYCPTRTTINSAISNLNFYYTDKRNIIPGLNNNEFVDLEGETILLTSYFFSKIENVIFKEFLIDSVSYGIRRFNDKFEISKYRDGFIINHKYTRKDVFRILNQYKNPNPQNVGGYLVINEGKECPIFVTYHKQDGISESTKYEDKFISNNEFEWMSKSKRYIESSDVQSILGKKGQIRLPLFIQKSNNEGLDFYYIGDMTPIKNMINQSSMKDNNQKDIPVVTVRFKIDPPVSDSLFTYFHE